MDAPFGLIWISGVCVKHKRLCQQKQITAAFCLRSQDNDGLLLILRRATGGRPNRAHHITGVHKFERGNVHLVLHKLQKRLIIERSTFDTRIVVHAALDVDRFVFNQGRFRVCTNVQST